MMNKDITEVLIQKLVENANGQKLKEERYYYGEIEDVKDKLNDITLTINELLKAINNIQGSQNKYSDEQIKLLSSVIEQLQDTTFNFKNINDSLSHTFKNRIRTLTPEERDVINNMHKKGEL